MSISLGDLDRSAVVVRLRAAGCVFAEAEAELLIEAAVTPAELEVLVGRRVAGFPLEQLLGWVAFAGARVAVEPGVFVPRRGTELLVREAVRVARPGDVVVDLCCGSGAIGLVVALSVEQIELHAVDVEPAAVRCARSNLESIGGLVYEGDLYAPLPARLQGRVDVLVVNAPYVPTDAVAGMPPEARDHEPWVALDGGPDGLDLLRRVVDEAPDWLAPGGHLLVETSRDQANQTASAIAKAGLNPQIAHAAEPAATAVIGTKRAGSN